ncbi:MAG: PASTA domain-containing protein [Armatimonadetes bacterium]|nr:PASTA domain-containing protein [Armatimonadota bacterium]
MEQTVREQSGGHRNRNTPMYVLVAVVVVAAIVVIALLSRSGTKGMVKVPELVGQPVEKAMAEATEVGLGVKEQMRVSSDSVAVGVVLTQINKPGTMLKKGDSVMVTVSKGPVTAVPELTGFTKSDAATELPKSGLVPGKVTTAVSTDMPPGRIVSMDPAPGTELMKGQPVNMVISKAPPPPPVPQSFVRPALEMTSVDVAEATDKGFNLAVGIAATNPNAIPGEVKGFYYKVEVDTFYLASAKQYCEMPLQPNSRGAMALSVNIRNDRLGRAAAALINRGNVNYRVRGYYILSAEGGRSVEPVAMSGNFNLAEKLGPVLGRAYEQ